MRDLDSSTSDTQTPMIPSIPLRVGPLNEVERWPLGVGFVVRGGGLVGGFGGGFLDGFGVFWVFGFTVSFCVFCRGFVFVSLGGAGIALPFVSSCFSSVDVGLPFCPYPLFVETRMAFSDQPLRTSLKITVFFHVFSFPRLPTVDPATFEAVELATRSCPFSALAARAPKFFFAVDRRFHRRDCLFHS